MQRVTCVLIAIVATAACGDNKAKPDAPRPIDAPLIDTPTDTMAPACDYTESHDATNDYNATGFVSEATGIQFNGSSARTICGQMNIGHFDSANGSIDIDDYTITLTSDADVLVTLTGDFSQIPNAGEFAVNASMTGVGQGFYYGTHGVFSNHFPAGVYHLSVEAYGNADATMAVPYKIKISPDNPTTRCPQITTAANYTEAHDGAVNKDNDMIQIDFSGSPPYYTLTTLPTDAPEPTGLTLAAGSNYRISGTSANVSATGSYFDGDTYLIHADATTDQIALRLNWPSTTADLDFYLFLAGTATPIETTATIALHEPEFKTIAVKPSSDYWLWVGASAPSSTGLPATYDFSICAEHFTP